MKKVLFVDDEPNILQGLQRMLRPKREDWEMYFANGGEEALNILQQAPMDVIITDMRMPGMDGAILLEKVSKLYPDVVRIVLSGYSDDVNILRSIVNSHQFLSKPCDYDTLIATLNRATWLQDYLNNPFLQRLTANTSSLPSHPSLYYEIVLMLEKPECTIKEIAEKISADIGMSAKILQLVNSAYFGSYKHITSLVQAINLIGLNMVKSLVLCFHVFSGFNNSKLSSNLINNLWKHSLQTAQVADRIARMEQLDRKIVEEAYSASLLHDVGMLILLNNLPTEYEPILMNQMLPDIPIDEAEEAYFGASHADVGAYLMGLWGLPESMMQAIAYHHTPSRWKCGEFNSIALVHAANVLTTEMNPDMPRSESVRFDEEYLDRLGLQGKTDIWRKQCRIAE